MKIRSRAGLAAGVLAAVLCAPAAHAAPANVRVRVEGSSSTLLPRTAVTTTTAPINKDGTAGHECSGTSAAGALERATAGNWVASWDAGFSTYFVTSILGESPGTNQFWNFWVNHAASDTGVCGAELQTGDDVLLYVDCFSACRKPLRLSRVPVKAAPGSTAAVLVQEYTAAFNGSATVTTAAPAAGATVTVGGRRFTTSSDGIARVSFAGSGPVSLRATKAGSVPSATESTCLTDGSDGLCGSVPPPDTTAPVAKITGIGKKTFSRRRAPRELHGTVTADPSGLWAVKIRLTRRFHGKCWYFSGSKERFLKRTCGKAYAFKVGDRADWSYLLPRRLRRGRYVLDTYAIDNAFNRGQEQTVRFRVR